MPSDGGAGGAGGAVAARAVTAWASAATSATSWAVPSDAAPGAYALVAAVSDARTGEVVATGRSATFVVKVPYAFAVGAWSACGFAPAAKA